MLPYRGLSCSKEALVFALLFDWENLPRSVLLHCVAALKTPLLVESARFFSKRETRYRARATKRRRIPKGHAVYVLSFCVDFPKALNYYFPFLVSVVVVPPHLCSMTRRFTRKSRVGRPVEERDCNQCFYSLKRWIMLKHASLKESTE